MTDEVAALGLAGAAAVSGIEAVWTCGPGVPPTAGRSKLTLRVATAVALGPAASVQVTTTCCAPALGTVLGVTVMYGLPCTR